MSHKKITGSFTGSTPDERLLQHRWHGWHSPVGLGLGLVCTGSFFALIALGIHTLAATPY